MASIDRSTSPPTNWRGIIDRVSVLVGLVALWQGLSWLLGIYWVSAPWPALSRFVIDIAHGDLLRHAGYTLLEAVVGFIIGGLPAVVLPFVLRRMPVTAAILDPFFVGGYGLPKLALAPLLILWFGIGIESKIALVAIAVFFIVYFSAQSGVRSLDRRLVQMAQIAGANERQIARSIVLPGAVPHIFSGFRIALPYAIGGAVVAEMISSNRGLGYLIQMGAMNFDTTQVFVAIVATTCIVLCANWGLNALEKRLLRWRPPNDSSTMLGEGF
jgi:NitT/TauT family transport system permease protein